MTLDEVFDMTLDQICDGGPYPAAADVLHGVPTGLPDTMGTLSAATLGLSAADLRKDVTVDVVTGTYDPTAAAKFPEESYVAPAAGRYGPTSVEYLGTLGDLSVTLSPAERNAIADAILVRGAENVEATAGEHSLCFVILALNHADTTTHDGKLTVFKTTGGEFAQRTLTTEEDAEPITGIE
jgi:hypothetical protein